MFRTQEKQNGGHQNAAKSRKMAPEDEGGSSTGPQLTEDDNCGRMEDDRSSDSGVPPGTLGSSTVTNQLYSNSIHICLLVFR